MAMMGLALALLAGAFGFMAVQELGWRCSECPIDRSGQLATIFFAVCVMLVAVAALHVIVAVGIWRSRRWAILCGLVLGAFGVAAMLWFARAPSYAAWFLAAAVIYSVVLVSLVI
jgi:uncharacterized membrane protein (DUF2068 family)